MTDNKEKDTKKTEEENKLPPPDVAKKTEKENPDPIPYMRFKEVNDELRELREWKLEQEAKEAERLAAEKEAKEKQLEKQQEFEKLANDRKAELVTATEEAASYKETVEAQTAVLEALYESRKSAVPEMFQPLLEAMELTKRLEWIAENEDKLLADESTKGLKGIPKTPAASNGAQLKDEEKRRRAARTF